MAYTAKPVSVEQANNDRYELFKTVTRTSVDNGDVDVLESIGSFSLDDLNRQKENLQNSITEIDEKITAIEAIQATQ